MNPANCNGQVLVDLCPRGSDNRCCIPAPPPQNPAPAPSIDGNQYTSQGGKCIDPNKCKSSNGKVLNNLCPGGSNNKCCVGFSNQTTTKTTTVKDDSKCTSQKGKCMNPNKCKSNNGKVLNNLCPGSSNNKCCVPKNTSTTSVKRVGSSCSDKGISGTCINIDSTKCNAVPC